MLIFAGFDAQSHPAYSNSSLPLTVYVNLRFLAVWNGYPSNKVIVCHSNSVSGSTVSFTTASLRARYSLHPLGVGAEFGGVIHAFKVGKIALNRCAAELQ